MVPVGRGAMEVGGAGAPLPLLKGEVAERSEDGEVFYPLSQKSEISDSSPRGGAKGGFAADEDAGHRNRRAKGGFAAEEDAGQRNREALVRRKTGDFTPSDGERGERRRRREERPERVAAAALPCAASGRRSRA